MAQRKAADRRTTGRVTPKGGPTKAKPKAVEDVDAGVASGRYTPPIPREEKVSPWYVPAAMFAFLGLGVVVIVLNYLGLLPGDTSNGYLLLGLGFITVGFVVATNYH